MQQVALSIWYHSEDSEFVTTFFNQTITVVEKSVLVDTEQIFMWLIIAGLLALPREYPLHGCVAGRGTVQWLLICRYYVVLVKAFYLCLDPWCGSNLGANPDVVPNSVYYLSCFALQRLESDVSCTCLASGRSDCFYQTYQAGSFMPFSWTNILHIYKNPTRKLSLYL
jgi:hypothetical protein